MSQNASTSRFSDAFDSAFAELVLKLGHLFGKNEFRQRIQDPELKIELDRLVRELRYWKSLRKLMLYIHKCSNAEEVVSGWRDLGNKIEDAFEEILDDIRFVRQNKDIKLRHLEVLDVLRSSETKIGLVKVDIGKALHRLSRVSHLLKWKISCLACDACDDLFMSISDILDCIRQETQVGQILDVHQRRQLEAFNDGMIVPLKRFLQSALYGNNEDNSIFLNNLTINKFYSHIANVAVSTANRSFVYWIRSKDADQVSLAQCKIIRLLDVLQMVDPLHPEFLDLILKFLTVLNKGGLDRSEDLVFYFCGYIVNQEWYVKSNSPKLHPLINFVINESVKKPPSEDVKCFVAEIKTTLILARLSCRHEQVPCLSNLELQTRICLLNIEVFLKHTSTMCTQDNIEKSEEVLKYLRSFIDESSQIREDRSEIFMLVIDLERGLTALYQFFCENRITKGRVRISLLILLLKIVIFKAKSSSVEVLKSLNTNEIILDNQNGLIETVLEGLNVFVAFISNQEDKAPIMKDAEQIFMHMEASTRGVTLLYYQFIVKKVTMKMSVRTNLLFSRMLDNMTRIKAKLREICPRFPRPKLPNVPGLGFIDFLLENLSEQLNHGPHSIALVKHHVEKIRSDLESLRSLLVKMDAKHLELRDLGKRTTNVSYLAEYIIDSIEVGIDDWKHMLLIPDLSEEIRLLKIQFSCTDEENICDARAHNVNEFPSHMISQVNMPEIGERVLCLSDVEEVVIDRLTSGSSQRYIIPIVGMPGIGKTTLAKKLYSDPKVVDHFHIRAWCSVSQGYTKRELLLDLLRNTRGILDNVCNTTDEDLEEDLEEKWRKSLMRRKYLIVMDDVWDSGAWNALERSFPDDKNGSRILMTSRLCEPYRDAHNLRLLTDDESWKLLQMKIFHGGGCPEQLIGVGKEIARRCKGLPLAIVAIAGLLERTEKTQDAWGKIPESLSSEIIEDPQAQCMDILQLSYNHLPDRLKACFLYFGAFLGDKDIPTWKLIRLWIAEGFIRRTNLKSLEDSAKDYLVDLIGRSLVTVSKEGSRRSIKACRIHDLLRDFCLLKAKDENFLHLINRHDEPYKSLSNFDIGGDYYDRYPLNPVTYESYRMCFVLKRRHFIKSSPQGPCTRSLIFHATSDMYPRCPYDVSFIPRHFRLLKVLDLETINMGNSFPTGMESLAKLRYLAVSGDIDFIPASIADLRKLETLIVKGLKGKVILPDSVWSMAHLRHIHVSDHVDFNSQDHELKSVLQFDNLVTFSSPLLSYGKRTEKILRRLPNLRKLGCIFLESWDDSRNYNKFPELDFLLQLESLNILYSGRNLNPGILNLPWNLKKLTLSKLHLPWTYIADVGRLQNLEVLKLLSQAFEGKRWDMREGEFLKLKYLKLDSLDIVHWNGSNNHAPELEHLVLRNCQVLEAVPYDFREIPTLEKIEVQLCGQSTEDSVRNIMDEGIEGIEIIVNGRVI